MKMLHNMEITMCMKCKEIKFRPTPAPLLDTDIGDPEEYSGRADEYVDFSKDDGGYNVKITQS